MSFAETLDRFKDLPPVTIGVAVVVVVLLIVGLRLLLKKPPAHLVAFSGEAGSVLVSRKALQELIKQTCLKDECVEAVRPSVKISSGIVNTHAELRLTSPENLKGTCERIQSRITALLEKSLNFDQIGSIEIVVSSFGADTDSNADLIDAPEGKPKKAATILEAKKSSDDANESPNA